MYADTCASQNEIKKKHEILSIMSFFFCKKQKKKKEDNHT